MSGEPLDVSLRVRMLYEAAGTARQVTGDLENINSKARQLGAVGTDRLGRQLREVGGAAQGAGRDLEGAAAQAAKLGAAGTDRIGRGLREVGGAAQGAGRELAGAAEQAAKLGAADTDRLGRGLGEVGDAAQGAGRELAGAAEQAAKLNGEGAARLEAGLKRVAAPVATASRGVEDLSRAAGRLGATDAAGRMATGLRASGAAAETTRREIVAIDAAVDRVDRNRGLAELDRDLVQIGRHADDAARKLGPLRDTRRGGLVGGGGGHSLVPMHTSAPPAARAAFANEALLASGVGGALRFGMGGAAAGGLALGGGIAATAAVTARATREAISFESAMTEVRKATAGTAEEMANLERMALSLSRKTGVALPDIAASMAQAGYFNISKEDMPDFADLSARAAVAFRMPGQEAGQRLAELSNAYGFNPQSRRLAADAINTIGDSAGTSERNIINFASRASGVAQMYNLPFAKTAAFGGGIMGMGVEPDVASTGFSALLGKLGNGNRGDKDFQRGMRAIGLSGRQVKRMVDADPETAMLTVLERIANLPKEKKANVISDIAGGEHTPAVARMAESLPKIAAALERVRDVSKYAGSLDRTFKIFSSDTQAALDRAGRSLDGFMAKIGQRFSPTVREAANLTARWLGGLSKEMERIERAQALAEKQVKGGALTADERAELDANPRLKAETERRVQSGREDAARRAIVEEDGRARRSAEKGRPEAKAVPAGPPMPDAEDRASVEARERTRQRLQGQIRDLGAEIEARRLGGYETTADRRRLRGLQQQYDRQFPQPPRAPAAVPPSSAPVLPPSAPAPAPVRPAPETPVPPQREKHSLNPAGLIHQAGMREVAEAAMETWPARAAKSTLEGLKLPGDVYAGRVDPYSQEGMDRARELAGGVQGGLRGAPARGAGRHYRRGQEHTGDELMPSPAVPRPAPAYRPPEAALPGIERRAAFADQARVSLAGYHDAVERGLARTERLVDEFGRRAREGLAIGAKVDLAGLRLDPNRTLPIQRASLGGVPRNGSGGGRGFGATGANVGPVDPGRFGGGAEGGGGTPAPRIAPGRFGITLPGAGGEGNEGGGSGGRRDPRRFGGGTPGGSGGDGAHEKFGDGGSTRGAARTGQMMGYAMDQLRREGVPENKLREAAAHLVGQAQMESGLDPNKSHDGGTGFGIYGARDPQPGRGRRTEMFKWLDKNGYARNSAEGQMRYMAHEAMSGRFKETRRILMGEGSGDIEADTNTITKEFESPKYINRRSGAVRNALRVGPEDSPAGSQGEAGAAQPGANGQFDPLGGAARRYSSGYGMRRHPIHGDMRMHQGQDLSAPGGTPVFAMQGGRVTGVDRHGDVTVSHPDGSTKTYRHIVPQGIRQGQTVEGGAPIGRLRQRDPRSTGPHLHMEATTPDGRRYDPRREIEDAQRRSAEPPAVARQNDAPPLEQKTPWTASRPVPPKPSLAPDGVPQASRGMLPPTGIRDGDDFGIYDDYLRKQKKAAPAPAKATKPELNKDRQRRQNRDGFIDALKDRVGRGEQFGTPEGEVIRRDDPTTTTLRQLNGVMERFGQQGDVPKDEDASGHRMIERQGRTSHPDYRPDRELTLDEIRKFGPDKAPGDAGGRHKGAPPEDPSAKHNAATPVSLPAERQPRQLPAENDPRTVSPRFAEPRLMEPRARPEAGGAGGGRAGAGGGEPSRPSIQNFYGGFDEQNVARRAKLEQNREVRRTQARTLGDIGRVG